MDTVFSNYFTSVFTEEDTSHFPPSVEFPNVKCTDVNFTVADVNDKLAKLRPDKAAGPDNLLLRFLLEIKDFITYLLLLRKSLDKNILPADRRVLTLVVFIKKGNRNKADNYHQTHTIYWIYQPHSTPLTIAAFDTVDHSVRTNVMRKRFGVSGKALG